MVNFTEISDQANKAIESLLEKADQRMAASLEKLPADNFRRKKTLQQSVQLLKRYRDIFLADDDSYATSSVILTTTAGQYYAGESSVYTTMDGIISRNVIDANRFQLIAGGRIKVLNPVNLNEDFTSKWDTEPKNYYEFLRFAQLLKEE